MNTIVNNKEFSGLAAKGLKVSGAVKNGVIFHLIIYVYSDKNNVVLVDENGKAFKIIK